MINLLESFKEESNFTKKKFGQHFLTNQHILNELVNACDVNPDDNIIEIGPGCGVLTQLLLERKANVKAIEIDKDLADFLKRYLFFYQKLTIINEDALCVDFDSLFPNKPVIFAGNLPYNISVRLFERAVLSQTLKKSMVFMFQKEVADRISANPNSKAYSSISIFASYFFNIKKIRDIGGGNFWPNAKVMSTILKFTPKDKLPLEKGEESDFFSFVHMSFSQKRKTLKNNLKNLENIDGIMSKTGLDRNTRAEELSIDIFLKLFKNLKM